MTKVNRMRSRSLSSRLNLAFLLVFALPVIAAVSFAIVHFGKEIERDYLTRLEANVRLTSLLIAHELHDIEDLVETCSRLNYLSVLMDMKLTGMLSEKLKQEAVAHGVDQMLILDRNGAPAAYSSRGGKPEDLSFPPWLVRAALRGEKSSGFEVIEMTGEEPPSLALTGVAPLLRSKPGETAGVVVVRRFIDNAYLAQMLQNWFPPDLFLFARNSLCAGYRRNSSISADETISPEVVQTVLERGEAQTVVDLGPKGRFTRYEPLLDPDGATTGSVMVAFGTEDFQKARKSALMVIHAILGFGLMLVLAVRLVIKRAILVPIARLREGTARIAGGDYSLRVEAETEDEIGDLSRSFNSMSVALDERTRDLEREFQERCMAEEALRESESRYRGMFEATPIGIFQCTPDGRFVGANPALARMMGYDSVEELLGAVENPGKQVYADPEWGKEVIERTLGSTQPHECEIRYKRKDGTAFTGSVHLWVVRKLDGSFCYLEGFIKDISARKKAEENLRLMTEKLREEHEGRKLLSKRLIEMIEAERKRISMELHDHIGQIATTLKMDLEVIDRHLGETGQEVRGHVEKARGKAVGIIRDLKNISFALRPSVLDHLGLTSSIENLVEDIRQVAKFEVHFFHSNVPDHMEPEIEITAYRIVQEALNNAVKYAEASNVYINLVGRDGVLSLSVEDDGRGLDTQAASQAQGDSKRPMGIEIMRERILQVDGEFSIESRRGYGLHLLAEIPLNRP
ncbi:MAG: PAS domain S-box protein [Acidobacteriota bacterium]